MQKMAREQFEHHKQVVMTMVRRKDFQDFVDSVLQVVLNEDVERVAKVNGVQKDDRMYTRDDMSRYLYIALQSLKSVPKVDEALVKFEKFRVVDVNNPQSAKGG